MEVCGHHQIKFSCAVGNCHLSKSACERKENEHFQNFCNPGIILDLA